MLVQTTPFPQLTISKGYKYAIPNVSTCLILEKMLRSYKDSVFNFRDFTSLDMVKNNATRHNVTVRKTLQYLFDHGFIDKMNYLQEKAACYCITAKGVELAERSTILNRVATYENRGLIVDVLEHLDRVGPTLGATPICEALNRREMGEFIRNLYSKHKLIDARSGRKGRALIYSNNKTGQEVLQSFRDVHEIINPFY